MSREWRRSLAAAMLLPLLLLASSATTSPSWLCGMMGVVRAGCCCPLAAHGVTATSDSPTSISAEPCCTMLHLESERADTLPARDASAVFVTLARPLFPTGVVLALPAPVPLRYDRVWHAKPPNGGRMLILSKRSLLI